MAAGVAHAPWAQRAAAHWQRIGPVAAVLSGSLLDRTKADEDTDATLLLQASDSPHAQVALTMTGTIRAASLLRPPQQIIFDAAEVVMAAHGSGLTQLAVLTSDKGLWAWVTEGLPAGAL